MSNEEKVIEIIEKHHNSIRFNDLLCESGIYIKDLFELIDQLIKEKKIDLRVNGPFEYYHVL